MLIKNHQSRLTCSKAFSEVNAVNSEEPEQQNYIPGRGRGWGRGRGHIRGQGAYNYNHSYNTTKDYYKKEQDERDHDIPTKIGRYASSSKGSGDTCHICGSKGNWAMVCRVP